jgi:hypothetical protein
VSEVPGRSALSECGDGARGTHDVAQLFDGFVDHFFSLISAVLVEASVSSSARECSLYLDDPSRLVECTLKSVDFALEGGDLTISRIGFLAARGSSESSLGSLVTLLTPPSDQRRVEPFATQ